MTNYDIKKMYDWPLGLRVLVIVLISIVLFILGYVIDVAHYKVSIASSMQQESNLKEQLQLMVDKQLNVKSSIEELPTEKLLLSRWQQNILSKDELPGMLNEILKIAQNNHLKVIAFDPVSEVKDGMYFKTPISMDITGTYDQIATFISQLANMQKLVNIATFVISRNTDPNANTMIADDTGQPLNSDAILSTKLDIEIYRK